MCNILNDDGVIIKKGISLKEARKLIEGTHYIIQYEQKELQEENKVRESIISVSNKQVLTEDGKIKVRGLTLIEDVIIRNSISEERNPKLFENRKAQEGRNRALYYFEPRK